MSICILLFLFSSHIFSIVSNGIDIKFPDKVKDIGAEGMAVKFYCNTNNEELTGTSYIDDGHLIINVDELSSTRIFLSIKIDETIYYSKCEYSALLATGYNLCNCDIDGTNLIWSEQKPYNWRQYTF